MQILQEKSWLGFVVIKHQVRHFVCLRLKVRFSQNWNKFLFRTILEFHVAPGGGLKILKGAFETSTGEVFNVVACNII